MSDKSAGRLADWAFGIAAIVPFITAYLFGLGPAIIVSVPLLLGACFLSVVLDQHWRGKA